MIGVGIYAISVVIVGVTVFPGVDDGSLAGGVIGCRNW